MRTLLGSDASATALAAAFGAGKAPSVNVSTPLTKVALGMLPHEAIANTDLSTLLAADSKAARQAGRKRAFIRVDLASQKLQPT